METIGILALAGLCFAAIVSVQIWIVWRRYRLIALMVPASGDPQVFSYKLSEAIRTRGFREAPEPGPAKVFRAPAWLKWVVGLHDISVQPAGEGAVLVTGPGFWVSSIAKSFTGVVRRPYKGRQPVWPLFKGLMRIGGILLVVTVAAILAAVMFAR
jgi:hypothetical protein